MDVDRLSGSLSQLSINKVTKENKDNNESFKDEQLQSRAEFAFRRSWKEGSKLRVFSQSKASWYNGTVIQLLNELPSNTNNQLSHSLFPKPFLNIRFSIPNINVPMTKIVNRHHHFVQPFEKDIESLKYNNKKQFRFLRKAIHGFEKLENIEKNLKKNIKNDNNEYLKAIQSLLDIMRDAQKDGNNWLTPKIAWIDIIQLLSKDINIALDPFVGDNAEHINWCKDEGLELKQYIADFYKIHYLPILPLQIPTNIKCIIGNPPYTPYETVLGDVLSHIKTYDLPSALLIPNKIFEFSWFWNIFNEDDDIIVFKPKYRYQFEQIDKYGRYSPGKCELHSAWFLLN